jgi:ectoine hydroxylase-related dioxygenase (phytanoyl-CoA dioxygenase family)
VRAAANETTRSAAYNIFITGGFMSTLIAEDRLTDSQRDTLIAQLDRDGFFVLPQKLPPGLIEASVAAIDRITVEEQRKDAGRRSVKKQNCVELDPAFLELMMYEPALQLAYDVFGPMFHLCQSNFVSRAREELRAADYVSASPWHADGPRPGLFPRVLSTHGPAMGLHYLKFGYFLTDLTHGNGGSLQLVRGSHRRDELDGNKGTFDIAKYSADVVQLDCEAGTVVAFHQAQWHAAPPNESDVVRKNVYISYCPTWMRPLDREFPTNEQLVGLTSEERWLLGEPRPAQRWWLPNSDVQRMARFKRDGEGAVARTVNYE